MACERFRETLADVAAAMPAPSGLEAHLASCEACEAELAALQRALAVADAEMARLLAAEPTPELAVRIRQAVAETEPSPGWRFGWLWPAVAAAATLLVSLAVVLGRMPLPESPVTVDAVRPQRTDSAPMAEPSPVIPRDFGPRGPEGSAVSARQARSATGSLPRDSMSRRRGLSPGPSEAPRGDRAPARLGSTVRRPLPPEPEVLVPPGGTEALLRFVTLVHRERLAPTWFAAAGEPSADLAEPALIDIKPLEIVPLDPAAISGT